MTVEVLTALMTAKPDEGTEHTRAKRSYSSRNGTTAIPNAAERPALARKAALARWGIKKLPPKRKPPLRGR